MFLRLCSPRSSNVKVEPTRNVLLNACRHADTARISQTFETSRDVHAVTEDVPVFDHDIAYVDAHSELDAAGWWHIGVTLGHAALPFGCTAQPVNDAPEFDEQPITGGLHHAAMMLADLRID